MGDTYSRIFIHVVFAVRNRKAQIQPDWEERLFKYICKTVSKRGEKVFAINGISDHIHILLSMHADHDLPGMVREVKKASTRFINEKGLTKGHFRWQNGYGAFSVSGTQLDPVIAYIDKQKEHHRQTSFKDEYIRVLKKNNVDFQYRNLFHWLNENPDPGTENDH